jgi:fumarylacetoacetate (FAA) hydrolase family protein
MKWPIMSDDEIHSFGIQLILSYIEKEDFVIEQVNSDSKMNPQIIGKRWGSLAFVYVRTACYPNKGALINEDQFIQYIEWAEKHNATAFFASVGLACSNYPDKTPVKKESDWSLPIRNAGFAVAYEGLLLMTMSDRVQILNINDQEPK